MCFGVGGIEWKTRDFQYVKVSHIDNQLAGSGLVESQQQAQHVVVHPPSQETQIQNVAHPPSQEAQIRNENRRRVKPQIYNDTLGNVSDVKKQVFAPSTDQKISIKKTEDENMSIEMA